MFHSVANSPDGPEYVPEYVPHPHWQDITGAMAPRLETGKLNTDAVGLLRTVLDAKPGDLIKPDPRVLQETFYSGEDLSAFTGEPEPVAEGQSSQLWSLTGRDVMQIFQDFDVIALSGDGRYEKTTDGFGALIKGPNTFGTAIGEYVMNQMEGH